MVLALICAAEDMRAELRGTAIGREDVDWRLAKDAREALGAAREVPPDIVLVDRDLPEADALVRAIRRDPRTRHTSIVLVAREEFDPIEVEILDLGANAVLRLPPDSEWDERLVRLMAVPQRTSVRLPVIFEVEARPTGGIEAATGVALNLSVSGMFLECRKHLEVGNDLDFRFRLPDDSQDVTGTGRVVRIAGPHRYGIEFYGLEGDGLERVGRHVRAQGSPAGE